MSDANYMQVLPGGHCFICHKDYTEYGKDHPCFQDPERKPTPCIDACKDSKYKIPPGIKLKPDMTLHAPEDPAEANICDGCQ